LVKIVGQPVRLRLSLLSKDFGLKMSAAIYISTEKPSIADQIAVNGKYFILHIDNISAIGEEHGLKRLDDFISYSLEETLEFIDESITPRDEVEKAYCEQWFDPKEGLELIMKYIELVKSYHSLSDSGKNQCLEDLEIYRSVLEILANKNIRWHFSHDL